MKFSSTFTATAMLFVGAQQAQAANYNIASSYNTLLIYDVDSTDPTFASEAMNSTTLATAGAVGELGDQKLTWSNIRQEIQTILPNLGWINQKTQTSNTQHCLPEGTTVEQAIASAYDSLDGPDSDAVRELLQSDQAKEIVSSWLLHKQCLYDGKTSCVQDGNSLSILYSNSAPTISMYTFVFGDDTTQTELAITSTVVTEWNLSQDLYDTVSDSVAKKLDVAKVQAQLDGPVTVNDVTSQSFVPVELISCDGGAATHVYTADNGDDSSSSSSPSHHVLLSTLAGLALSIAAIMP